MKAKKKIIFSSALAIAMSASVIAGSTYALFTSESEVNVAVTSAKVNVSAAVAEESIVSGTVESDLLEGKNEAFGAKYKDGVMSLTNMAAGDFVAFDIVVTNESTIDVKYRSKLSVRDGVANGEAYANLFGDLEVTFGGAESFYNGDVYVSQWQKFVGDPGLLNRPTKKKTIPVRVSLPVESKATDAACTLTFGVEAIQGNAETKDETILSPVQFNALTKESLDALCGAEEGACEITVAFDQLNLDKTELELGLGFKENPDSAANNPHILEVNHPINLTLIGNTLNTGSTGFKDVNNIAESGIKFSLPRKSTVTVKNITVNGSYYFGINRYRRAAGYEGIERLTFENCTFNGGWAGYVASEELNFINCTFQNCTNSVSSTNCMPFWLDPSGESAKTISMTDCRIFAASAVKFENFTGTNFVFENNEFTMDKKISFGNLKKDYGIEFVNCKAGNLTLTSNKLLSGTALVSLYKADNSVTFTGVTATDNVDQEGQAVTLCGRWKSNEVLNIFDFVVSAAE